jgi:hypothetical protein
MDEPIAFQPPNDDDPFTTESDPTWTAGGTPPATPRIPSGDPSAEPIPYPEHPAGAKDAAYLAKVEKDLGAAFPRSGFLRLWLQGVTRLTDSPAEFHLMAGFMILAAVIGNRCYLERHGDRSFASLWAVMIAPSGDFHKSTACKKAMGAVERTADNLTIPDSITFEGLFDHLTEQPSGLMYADEWKSFAEMLNADYNKQLRARLITFYESTYTSSRRTSGKGLQKCYYPTISIMSATTMEWFEKNVRQEDVATGWLNRFFFVIAPNGTASDKFMDGKWLDDEHRALLDGLKYLNRPEIGTTSKAEGGGREMGMTPAAKRMLQDWHDGWRDEQRADMDKTGLDLFGFGTRLEGMAIKFAMLNHFSRIVFDRSIPTHTIDAEDIELGIAWGRLGWKNVLWILGSGVAWDDRQANMRTVLRAHASLREKACREVAAAKAAKNTPRAAKFLEITGGAFRSDIARRVYKSGVDAKKLDEVEVDLRAQARLTIIEKPNPWSTSKRDTSAIYWIVEDDESSAKAA